ncbi:MAG TPA: hypothetical protein VLA12_09560, partial [Planctomycetaceae bacterium]|nr:hypothetical protein [Planctomycetaceae bacterium]
MKSKILIATALFITLVLILSRQTVPVSETVAAEPVANPAPEQLAVQLAKTDAPPVIDPHEYDPQDTRFLMHEWGTFTSFSGADGVKLEFRPLADNDLPQFVLDRPRQGGIVPLSALLSKGWYLSWQRLETPVIYFYTPEEMDVSVKVS